MTGTVLGLGVMVAVPWLTACGLTGRWWLVRLRPEAGLVGAVVLGAGWCLEWAVRVGWGL